MRISDWSSDVCSSDLEVRSASSSCRTMPRAPWAKHGCALGRAAVPMQGLEDVRASALLATLSDHYPGLCLTTTRSEERREGKECASTFQSTGAPITSNQSDLQIKS